MTSRSPALSRFLAAYGMVFVLALLCTFFSFATYNEQHPTGADAARELASSILGQFGKSARVLIAVPNQPDADAFADALQTALTNSGATVVTIVKGEPKDARAALQTAASAGKLDAIACTQASAGWLVFAELATDFPALGNPRIVQPQTYHWPNFLKRDNLLNIANQIAVIAIVAIGMTLACLSAILIAGGAGAVNGALVTVFHLPPFIVTLAMMLVASGAAYLLTHGQSVYQVPNSFVWLGRGADAFGLPNAVLLMALLYVAAHLLMKHTVLGRWLYAIGGNRQAARYSGVPVRRVLFLTYVVSGLLAGLGGVVLASQLKSGSPTFGQMYELYVIAAVVVGGASLNGGTGRMFGTLTGALIIAVIQNGMNLMNVESYTQKVVLGLVILGAVLLDLLRHRGWRLQLSATE